MGSFVNVAEKQLSQQSHSPITSLLLKMGGAKLDGQAAVLVSLEAESSGRPQIRHVAASKKAEDIGIARLSIKEIGRDAADQNDEALEACELTDDCS